MLQFAGLALVARDGLPPSGLLHCGDVSTAGNLDIVVVKNGKRKLWNLTTSRALGGFDSQKS